jgi:hypothetical protein
VCLAAASIALLAVDAAAAGALGLGGCSGGNSFSWTGEGDGHSWTDPENWSPEEEAPPKSGDSATIQGSEAAEAEVEGAGGEVCELTVEGSDAFLTSSNLTVEGNLTWEGGQGTHAPSELEGTFDVEGTASLSHKLALGGGTTLATEGSLEVEGGTELILADGSTKVVSNGSAEIGGGVGGLLGGQTIVASNSASEGDDNAKLQVNGSLAVEGDVESPQLDLNLGPQAAIDLEGNEWVLPGLSFSRWKGGSKVDSSSEGGVIAFNNLAELLVDGDVTIGEHALVSMRDTSTLTDGEPALSGSPGTVGLLRGAGTLEWQSGSFERQLTLAPNFHTVLDTGGIHTLINEPGTLLRNEGTLDVQSGELLVDGKPATVQNWGTTKVHAGAVLACNSSDCGAGAIDNAPGAELEVVGPAPLQPPATKVPATVISLHNSGDIRIGEGLMLQLEHDAVANLADGGTISGGGILRLGEEGKANVVGETTLLGGSVLSIDGNEAELHGGTVNAEGTLFTGVLNAAAPGDGSLEWIDGGLEGSLLTDNQLQTIVEPGAEPGTSRTIDPDIQDKHEPTRNPTSITLASPSHVDGAMIAIESTQNGDAVTVDGAMTIAGTAGFTRGSSDADGVIVDPSGSIRALGNALIEAPLAVLGELIVPSTGVLGVPLGYTQTGGSAQTLLEGGRIETLTEPEGERQTLQLDGGSFHGPGAVVANVVSPGATVSPSADNATPGLLRIEGDYTQNLGGALTAHVAGSGAGRHDRLAVSGAASIAGGLAAVTVGGYQPAVPTTVPDVLDGGTLTGNFSSVSSTGAPANTAWQAAYRPGAVDLVLGSTGGGKQGFGKGQPKVKLKGGLHLLKGGVVSMTLANSGDFPVKVVSVTLSVPKPGGKKLHKRSMRSRGVTIGAAKPGKMLQAGGSAKITVHLNGRGRSLVKGKRALKVGIAVKLSAPDGSKATLNAQGRL